MRFAAAWLFALVACSLASAGSWPVRTLALVDARSGKVDTSFPDLTVSGVVGDGRGGWFASGARGVVRLTSRARVDHSWHAPLISRPGALTRFGSRLYVGFRPAAGMIAVAALDARTGRRVWTSGRFGGRNLFALAADRRGVFAAGDFKKPRSPAWLLHFDARTGARLRFDVAALRRSSTIETLALGGGRLYAGGVLAAPHPLVVALDEQTGHLLPWQPHGFEADETSSIAVTGKQVILGGVFSFGAFDARTGRKLAWSRQVGGAATVVVADGPRLYLAGNLRSGFTAVGGRRANNLAAYDLRARHWTPWTPVLAKFTSVAALAPSGGKLLIIGAFSASIG